jgi:hypothetical protein
LRQSVFFCKGDHAPRPAKTWVPQEQTPGKRFFLKITLVRILHRSD